MTTLHVENLGKSFGGVRAVRDLSFTVRTGEVVALIGPNGAGKSTSFNMLNGQLRPDTGRIVLDGVDIAGLSPQQICRRGVGRTFQITATFASMTLRENVRMALLSHYNRIWRFWNSADARFTNQATMLLDLVGLRDQTERAAGVLAYGDLKRLELAMALATAPKLLLMDEPTAGMAPDERAALMALVRSLAQRREVAVLFTEHDMDVVFNTADRILVMNDGALIAAGTPAEIRANALVRDTYLGGVV